MSKQEMPHVRRPLRAAFIGWGAINVRVGALLAQRNAAVEIVGIATIDTPENRAAIPREVHFLAAPSELASLRPDLVVEAAGRAAIDMWAEAALLAAPAMIIASTSAFCDDALLARLTAVAEQHGSRIFIPSGAIGAVDALASAAVLGLDEVTHQIVKPPARGAFGRLEILLENNPLATNPKSSELTALSLVRLIEHQTKMVIV